MEIVEKCYAKVNLTLRVKEKMSSFHKVETIMAPLDLYDTITIKAAESFDYTPVCDNDIVLKAVRLFQKKYNVDLKVAIKLEKRIPVAAGLAGGSADAAGVLRALNRYYNLNLELRELEELCNQIGSDVSYCLYNKLAYCTGRGEQVEILPSPGWQIPIVLIKPKYGLSTKEIYQNYNYQAYEYDLKNILNVIAKKDVSRLEEIIFNDLDKPASQVNPSYLVLKNEFKKQGFRVYQSGSGPTLFCFDLSVLDIVKKVDCDLQIFCVNLLI